MIQLQTAELPTGLRSGGMQGFARTVRKQKLHLQALLPDNPQSQNKSQVEWAPSSRNVIIFRICFM